MSHAELPTTTSLSDDPRLTAYALGELDGGEAQAFEALLAADPAAKAEVEALRALGGDLSLQLASSQLAGAPAAEGLAPQQRAAVTAASAAPTLVRPPTRLTVVMSVAVAAGLLVGLPVLLGLMASGSTSDEPGSHAAAVGKTPLDARETGPAVPSGKDGVDGWTFPHASDGTILRDEVQQETERANRTAIKATNAEHERLLAMGVATREAKKKHDLLQRRHRFVPPNNPWAAGSAAAGGGSHARPGVEAPAGPATLHLAPPTTADVGRVTAGTVLVTDLDKNGTYGFKPGDEAAKRKANELLGYAEIYNARFHAYTRGYANGVWQGWSVQTHGEQYVHPGIDGFLRVGKRAGHTSTFSIDVDTASYTNVRRMLNHSQRPHPAAVRIEEFVNYFDYDYKAPADDAKQPFASHVQIAACPWSPKHRLARIALKGKEFKPAERPASNLVFLIDVSGSMEDEDKLPLLKSGLELLTESLDARDRVSIVTYSGSAVRALESTPGSEQAGILAAIRGLRAGGSTNGAAGIQLAYDEARKGFLKEGVNRVILCTDGDFNVGIADGPGLSGLVAKQAKSGVYLSVLGFGTGNLQDGKMEAYSNAGNGNYAYIDSLAEAKRVLVEQMQGTLITIAKDVKFQVWFNPKTVSAWRLLGYENRKLAAKDFNNDAKDAGDIGAGHAVTALYELIPTGVGIPGQVDPNPFVNSAAAKDTDPKKAADEPKPRDNALFVWRLRWKKPDGDTSELVEQNVFDSGLTFEKADREFQWAAAVTAFGMQLRHSPHRGQSSWELIEELAKPATGEDPKGRRAEFLGLVAKAKGLGR